MNLNPDYGHGFSARTNKIIRIQITATKMAPNIGTVKTALRYVFDLIFSNEEDLLGIDMSKIHCRCERLKGYFMMWEGRSVCSELSVSSTIIHEIQNILISPPISLRNPFLPRQQEKCF